MGQTVRTQFASTAYFLAAAGPCLIEPMDQGRWRIHVGTSAPTTGTDAYHRVKYPEGTFSYAGTENVYLQADHADYGSAYVAITTMD